MERLRELRRERVLSLRELEHRSGVSYNTIWRIKDSHQGAHLRTIRKLAEALGVQPRADPGRGVGMAATVDRITKRKDGLFQGMYTAQTPDGPKRKYIYGRKYKDVEKKLAEAMGNAARGSSSMMRI